MLRYAPDNDPLRTGYQPQPPQPQMGGGAWGSYYGSGTGFMSFPRQPQGTEVINRMYPSTGIYGDFLRNLANVGRIRTTTQPQPATRGTGLNLAGMFGGGS